MICKTKHGSDYILFTFIKETVTRNKPKYVDHNGIARPCYVSKLSLKSTLTH